MANYLDNDIKFVAGVGEARARLLELFDLAMPDDPAVAAARRALASALY